MTDEKNRVHYDEGDFQCVIGVDHVSILGTVHGIMGITPVGGGVMLHRRLLAQVVRFLDSNTARDALALPRVVRVTRTGMPIPDVENPSGTL